MAEEIQRILIKYEADAKELRKDLDGVKKQLRDTDKEAGRSGKAITATFKSVAAGIAAAFSVQQVIQFGQELNRLQKEAQGVRTAFNNAFDAGALTRLRQATAGTVSDLELMKVALRAKEFNIPQTTLARGLEFARIQANKLGQDVGFLTNSIVDGLGRKSPLILDNLGISQAELSEKVKETGDFYAGVAAVIEDKLGDSGAAGTIETLADRQARVNAQLENLRLRLSDQLVPLFDSLTQAALNALDAIEQVSKFGLTVGSEAQQQARREAEETLNVQVEAIRKQVEAGDLTRQQARSILEQTIEGLNSNFEQVQEGLDLTGEKARRFLGVITGVGGPGIAQALGQFGLGQGAREGAEELLRLDAEIQVLTESLGDFQDAVEPANKEVEDTGKKAKKSAVELTEFAAAYRQALEDAIAFRQDFDALDDGFLFNTSNLDAAWTEYRGELLNRFEELKQDIEDFNEDAEDLRVLGVTPEQFNQNLANARDNTLAAYSAIALGLGTISNDIAVIQGNNAERSKGLATFEILLAQSVALAQGIQSAATIPFPGNLAAIASVIGAITGFFAQVKALEQQAQVPGFAVGTSDAPGGAAWVGEEGPEIMHVPKGARIFTADASKREKSLIDAINEGRVSAFIEDTYVKPALSTFADNLAKSAPWQAYDDFYLRQAVKANKTVELGPRTRKLLDQNRQIRFH